MEPVQPAKNNLFGITSLDPTMLSSTIPTRTHGGGPVIGDSSTMLFLWRSCGSKAAAGATICFYLSDDRLEPLASRPAFYALGFVRDGVAIAIEPDFSLWRDDPLEEQLHNVRRTRVVSRIFQEYGIAIIPGLNWADEQSYPFCFAGIPQHAPVVSCECRTASSCDSDRRRFLAGLAVAVKQLEPQSVLIYGAKENGYWLADRLPPGPVYHMLESFMTARGRIRKTEKREARDRNQLQLFGGETWVEEAQVAAA